jgi:3-oxoacyl-[acyl-carrier-protein] synthase III
VFLRVAVAQILTNLSEYGNTSAGSIPLALDEAVRSGKVLREGHLQLLSTLSNTPLPGQVKKGDVIACAGFGAGLSWGAAIIKWGGV